MTELVDGGWVPATCTLPTAERPLRRGEFNEMFSTVLREQERVSPLMLRWVFDPAAEVSLRDLTARESECCSFFGFGFSTAVEGLLIDVTVPAAQVAVLDALQARAAARLHR